VICLLKQTFIQQH